MLVECVIIYKMLMVLTKYLMISIILELFVGK